MAAGVILEVFLACERFAAYVAIVRFVGAVTFHVTFQRRLIGKDVEADAAREHAAAQMTLTMSAQFLGVREGFTAYLKLFKLIKPNGNFD